MFLIFLNFEAEQYTVGSLKIDNMQNDIGCFD